ncbi:hypothetical protein, partial [Candidatus Igneacidithiobacillus taiwanensis]|uniref:hypothetical protein n=1 Tax=Candidatus Igneacidithiobacillus taiwanensis TaxID=1945924 RepID=UPI00289798C5
MQQPNKNVPADLEVYSRHQDFLARAKGKLQGLSQFSIFFDGLSAGAWTNYSTGQRNFVGISSTAPAAHPGVKNFRCSAMAPIYITTTEHLFYC